VPESPLCLMMSHSSAASLLLPLCGLGSSTPTLPTYAADAPVPLAHSVKLIAAVQLQASGRTQSRACYSSCGMPGSGQARTCVELRCKVAHSKGRATGIGCQATNLIPLQPVRVHEGEAGQRQHTQLRGRQ